MNLSHIVAAFAAVLAFTCAPSLAAPPKAGDVAPNEIGKTLAGQKVFLSDHAGKVIVVSFWATWCKYCLKELPVLENIQKIGKEHKVQVFAVNTEDLSTFRRVTRIMKDFSMGMANDHDKIGQSAYGVQGIPHLVIIGRDGVIVQVYRGYGEETLDQIAADINKAMMAGAAPGA